VIERIYKEQDVTRDINAQQTDRYNQVSSGALEETVYRVEDSKGTASWMTESDYRDQGYSTIYGGGYSLVTDKSGNPVTAKPGVATILNQGKLAEIPMPTYTRFGSDFRENPDRTLKILGSTEVGGAKVSKANVYSTQADMDSAMAGRNATTDMSADVAPTIPVVATGTAMTGGGSTVTGKRGQNQVDYQSLEKTIPGQIIEGIGASFGIGDMLYSEKEGYETGYTTKLFTEGFDSANQYAVENPWRAGGEVFGTIVTLPFAAIKGVQLSGLGAKGAFQTFKTFWGGGGWTKGSNLGTLGGKQADEIVKGTMTTPTPPKTTTAKVSGTTSDAESLTKIPDPQAQGAASQFKFNTGSGPRIQPNPKNKGRGETLKETIDEQFTDNTPAPNFGLSTGSGGYGNVLPKIIDKTTPAPKLDKITHQNPINNPMVPRNWESGVEGLTKAEGFKYGGWTNRWGSLSLGTGKTSPFGKLPKGFGPKAPKTPKKNNKKKKPEWREDYVQLGSGTTSYSNKGMSGFFGSGKGGGYFGGGSGTKPKSPKGGNSGSSAKTNQGGGGQQLLLLENPQVIPKTPKIPKIGSPKQPRFDLPKTPSPKISPIKPAKINPPTYKLGPILGVGTGLGVGVGFGIAKDFLQGEKEQPDQGLGDEVIQTPDQGITQDGSTGQPPWEPTTQPPWEPTTQIQPPVTTQIQPPFLPPLTPPPTFRFGGAGPQEYPQSMKSSNKLWKVFETGDVPFGKIQSGLGYYEQTKKGEFFSLRQGRRSKGFLDVW